MLIYAYSNPIYIYIDMKQDKELSLPASNLFLISWGEGGDLRRYMIFIALESHVVLYILYVYNYVTKYMSITVSYPVLPATNSYQRQAYINPSIMAELSRASGCLFGHPNP